MRASGKGSADRPREGRAAAHSPRRPGPEGIGPDEGGPGETGLDERGSDERAPDERRRDDRLLDEGVRDDRVLEEAGRPEGSSRYRGVAQVAPRRRRRLWPIPLALLGLAALAAAAYLAWSVAPDRTQLPADYAATRDITGTANALLNQPALAAGDAGGALVSGVPVTGQRTVRVVSTSGRAAQVQEERTLTMGGQPIGSGSATYAVDRLSLEPETDVPEDWTVDPHQGLTVAFPVDAERRDYTIWVPDLQTTAPLRFVREEPREGVNTYVYEAAVPETPIQNPAVLSALPAGLSRSALQGLLPALPVSEEQRAVLAQAVRGLPDEVPVRYTYQGTATYWVEPTTGTIVDIQQQVIRTGTVGGPGGAVLATLPVYNVDTRFDDASVAAAVREATDRREALTAVSSTWPWVLLALGVVALVVALIGLLARRRSPRRPAPPPAYRPTERTTRVDLDTAKREAARRADQPQPPYVGQTPHTGPYRESAHREGLDREEPHREGPQHEAPAGQATGQPDVEHGRTQSHGPGPHGPGRPPPGTPEP
jgi:hypothetical protein